MTKSQPDRITLATWLTLARIALAVVLGPAILLLHGWPSAVLIAAAAATDYLDGFLARKRDEVSKLGATLDPIADKLVTVSVLLAMSAGQIISGIHLIIVFAILLREMLIAGLREAAAGSVSLAVSPLAKWKTAIQFFAFFVLCFGANPLGLASLWIAGALTVWTGYIYVVTWWAKAG